MSQEKKLITIYIVECKTPNHFYIGDTAEPFSRKLERIRYKGVCAFLDKHGFKSVIYTDGTFDPDYAAGRVNALVLQYMEQYGLDHAAGGPWSQVHKTTIPYPLRGKVQLEEVTK